ncbi:MAG TPA: ECF-type sigma factor [Steroidobacteraceae bacterium]|jgi:RNA polymerase sigma factor (TIGR02999 family)|nr:ECF-type sigma factor [Steroidobacteraceae bacterium]
MSKSKRFKALVQGETTRLLSQWRAGDQAAFERLWPIVYEELRRLASRYMRSERPDHLLQTTALVHEAYLRLVDQPETSGETRSHFLAVAAQVMRHVLVDYARARARAKRGGGVAPLPLEDVAVISAERADELIAVDAALEGLMAFDLRKGRIFELRHYGGLSVEEAAQVLQVSPATVARDWRMAKAWLRRAITSESHRAV